MSKLYVGSDTKFEREICFHCEAITGLLECEQTEAAGCPHKQQDIKEVREVYQFLQRNPMGLNEIKHHFNYDDDFISDALILLSNAELIRYGGGKWFSK